MLEIYVCHIIFLVLLHIWMFWISFSEQVVHTSISFDALNGPFKWLGFPREVLWVSQIMGTRVRNMQTETSGRVWLLDNFPQLGGPFLYSKVLFSPSLQSDSSCCLSSASDWTIVQKVGRGLLFLFEVKKISGNLHCHCSDFSLLLQKG